ncbi:MAG: alanine dehydrogenase [Bacteroidetes bacterium]|nr:alanine dehydrogenase [Bacteroidota bacterium]
MKQVRIGIIRESKIPPDSRVALTPAQCKRLLSENTSLEIYLQPSKHRCIPAQEYSSAGVRVREDMTNCDILMAIKEVPISNLISNKTYTFFSHTIKKQPKNRDLLKQILVKKINLIDYECLTNDEGARLAGFGRIAGMVGAHNAFWTWGKRTGAFKLKRAFEFDDLDDVTKAYKKVKLPPIKIVLTGTGSAATGAKEMLDSIGVPSVSSADFLKKKYRKPVYLQLDADQLYAHRKNKKFELQDFIDHPGNYKSVFDKYLMDTDMLINAIYWDPGADKLFTKEQMKDKKFSIQVISDIACDVNGAIPSTIRASNIENPVYGYSVEKESIVQPYNGEGIDIMAIDNLPNELPKDASIDFGEDLMDNVMSFLIRDMDHEVIQRAMISKDGSLMKNFEYLDTYANS